MAATLATSRLFDGFLGDPERAFYYGHTFCGNPLGSAVAREVLRVFEEEAILANAEPKAKGKPTPSQHRANAGRGPSGRHHKSPAINTLSKNPISLSKAYLS